MGSLRVFRVIPVFSSSDVHLYLTALFYDVDMYQYKNNTFCVPA